MPRKYLIILILVLLIAVIVGAILVLQRMRHLVHETYALESTNYLLIEYVCQYEKWPSNWEELIPVAEFLYPRSGNSYVAELRKAVGINWKLDLQSLLETKAQDDRSDFQTTHRLSDRTVFLQDPTEQIYFGILRECQGESP